MLWRWCLKSKHYDAFNGSRRSILHSHSDKVGRERGGVATPVPMHVGGAESKAVVKEGGVDDGPALRPLQEVPQVAQVSVTTPDAVPGAVLVQDKHLARAEPSLHTNTEACQPSSPPDRRRGRHSPGSRRCR